MIIKSFDQSRQRRLFFYLEEEAFIVIKYRLCWEIAQSCFDYSIKTCNLKTFKKKQKINLLRLKPFCITKTQRRSEKNFTAQNLKYTVFAAKGGQ